MIGMTDLVRDQLLVGMIAVASLFIVMLTRFLRSYSSRPPYRPTAGRRSHAVTVRGVRPSLRMKRQLTPAQREVVKRLYEQAEPVKLSPR